MDVTQKRLKSFGKAPMTRNVMDGVDRISNLPNEVLCHILSFLPTTEAVATAILSTKWKNLFPLIPNLKIKLNDALLLRPEKSYLNVVFMNFLDRLLNVTLRDAPSISSFHLNLQKIDDGREIGNWVTSALLLNVKKMNIRNKCLRNSSFFLNSLFGCNLVSLSLRLNFADDARECRFRLPNLKRLCVQTMKFKVVNILLEGCPSLEKLYMYDCYCYPREILHICMPSLKALKLLSNVSMFEGEIELYVPNLQYCHCSGYFANRYLGEKVKSLHMARFDLIQNVSHYAHGSYAQAAQLMELCSSVEKLCVSESFIMVLHHLPGPMPRFENLVVITIMNIKSCLWKLIPSLLESAPKFEYVIVKSGFEEESYEHIKASLNKPFSIFLSKLGDKSRILKIERGVGRGR